MKDEQRCHLPGCPHGAECVHAKPAAVERKPLTDAQIEQAIRTAVNAGLLSWLGFKKDESGQYTVPVLSTADYQAARAIERAHGITE